MAILIDGDGNPYLDIDDLVNAIPAGWTLTDYGRYDPTQIDGTTPSGKTFTAQLANSIISLTIEGNTQSQEVAKSIWLSGANTWTELTRLRGLFPAGQQ